MGRAEMLARRAELRSAVAPHRAEVVLVTGPPCSGKSTYVSEHAQHGDVVIDYDALAVALGSRHSHDHPEVLRPVVLAAWLAALSAAETSVRRVWVIRGFPEPRDLTAASRVVRLDVPADECKRRAAAERPDSWPDLIDKWWARYGPT